MPSAVLQLPNRYTYEDLACFPQDNLRREILDGDLIVNPAPYLIHQRVSRNLEVQIHLHLEASHQGEIFYAPVDVRLGADVFEPDLVVVLKGGPAQISEECITGAPDLLVEILSKGTENWDRVRKAKAYARAGVHEYWLVDPKKRVLERLVLRSKRYHLVGTHSRDVVETPLMPGLRVQLSKVWAR